MIFNIKKRLALLPRDEKANFLTHGIALACSLFIVPFVLLGSASGYIFWGNFIFNVGLAFLFFASTFYHRSVNDIHKKRWQIVDHIAIYILIGCTYTSFILQYYNTSSGMQFLGLHWGIIFFGILFKLVFKNKFELISLLLYLVLGWMVIFIYDEITLHMNDKVVFCLIAGGISYTIGVYFYLHSRRLWFHAIWHIFVIIGSAMHMNALIK